MLYFDRWKILLIAVVSLGGILFSLPNLFTPAQLQGLPSWMQLRMPLGLDLQGGSHLLLQMNAGELRDDWLEAISGDARTALREERIGYSGLSKTREDVRATIRNPEDIEKALTKLRTLARPTTNTILGSTVADITVERGDGNVIIIKPTEVAMNERISSAVGSGIETIRRRVDALGTTEPTIQRHGRDRILLQVPGFNDPGELKALVGQTAKLTFHLVDPTMSAAEAQAGNPPPGSGIYQSRTEGEPAYLLQKRSIVTGEDLVDSQPSFDQQTNEPVVSFRFNASGRAALRPRDAGKCRPPLRHRARRQGDLRAGHPRADPGRLGPDFRQFQRPGSQQPLHPAALRRAARLARHHRGAHGRPEPWRRFHRGRHRRRC